MRNTPPELPPRMVRLAALPREGERYSGIAVRSPSPELALVELPNGRLRALRVRLLTRDIEVGESIAITFVDGRGHVHPPTQPRTRPSTVDANDAWARPDHSYTGRVIEILADVDDPSRARVVVQRDQNSDVVYHDERDLETLPRLGAIVTIAYHGGRATVAA